MRKSWWIYLFVILFFDSWWLWSCLNSFLCENFIFFEVPLKLFWFRWTFFLKYGNIIFGTENLQFWSNKIDVIGWWLKSTEGVWKKVVKKGCSMAFHPLRIQGSSKNFLQVSSCVAGFRSNFFTKWMWGCGCGYWSGCGDAAWGVILGLKLGCLIPRAQTKKTEQNNKHKEWKPYWKPDPPTTSLDRSKPHFSCRQEWYSDISCCWCCSRVRNSLGEPVRFVASNNTWITARQQHGDFLRASMRSYRPTPTGGIKKFSPQDLVNFVVVWYMPREPGDVVFSGRLVMTVWLIVCCGCQFLRWGSCFSSSNEHPKLSFICSLAPLFGQATKLTPNYYIGGELAFNYLDLSYLFGYPRHPRLGKHFFLAK